MIARREGWAVWTPVETALPDENVIVSVAIDDGVVWPAYLDSDRWEYFAVDPIETGRVTHWTHMPAHPAELEDK